MILVEDFRYCLSFIGMTKDLDQTQSVELSTDTRTLKKGEFFLAITGDKFSSTVYRDGIRINGSSATDNVTIASGERAMVAGDYTIPTNKTLTVNGVLTIV